MDRWGEYSTWNFVSDLVVARCLYAFVLACLALRLATELTLPIPLSIAHYMPIFWKSWCLTDT